MSGALSSAVEQLYRVFAPYKAPRTLHATPTRDAAAILHDLLSAPLRELGEKQVMPYAGWAMTMVGDSGDYKHFLPRIFELALNGAPYIGAEPAVIVSKLRTAGWDGWRDDERSAVCTAFLAAWEWALWQDPSNFESRGWLIGAAALGDTDRALEAWRQSSSPYAGWHLARVLSFEKTSLEKGKGLSPGWWSCLPNDSQTVIQAWLCSDESRQMLERAILSPAGADTDEKWWWLESALDMLPLPEASVTA